MKIRKEQLADNVTVYCGDCREVIPTLDLRKNHDIVSDPPYGIESLVGGYGRTSTTTKGVKIAQGRDTKIANDKNLSVVVDAFTLLRKQLKDAWVMAFYSCRITPVFFKDMAMFKDSEYFGELLWNKIKPGLGTQIRYQHENVAVWQLGKPLPLYDVMSVISFITPANTAGAGGLDSKHPHEKPHNVMTHVVGCLPENRIVLDPFMGTGSTGAAAVHTKRGFVGIELDPKHFDVAVRKIGAAIKQPVAFWE